MNANNSSLSSCVIAQFSFLIIVRWRMSEVGKQLAKVFIINEESKSNIT
jgi:hypothetical protein